MGEALASAEEYYKVTMHKGFVAVLRKAGSHRQLMAFAVEDY